MSLALHLAHMLIQNSLHARSLTHLSVKIQGSSLYIYSLDKQQDESCRAALTMFAGNLFMLSVANPKGQWQPVPYFGQPSELLSVLTNKFAFALSRWSK
ncbi:hypothetical protein [Cohnella yongneupensis]|uniref:Uncharacterized protein n=1 Tax=Cohnella yongneupensis TaxID=425006 RepID=A0ABW0R095_9BACL